MTDLAATQRLLWKLITAPEGTQAGLEQLNADELALYDGLVRGDGRLSAVERLDVYANMYFFRLLDCVRDDYPTLVQLIGDAAFHNLITDYLLAHPPQHFSLRYAGEKLCSFVESHPVCQLHPAAGDLAQLEWAFVEAFDAADATPLDVSELAAIAPERWGELQFELHPSLRLVSTEWSVLLLWEARQGEETLPPAANEEQYVRVWRSGLRLRYRPMNRLESVALSAVRDGASFAEVCALVAEVSDETTAAEQAASLLAQWVTDELVVACVG